MADLANAKNTIAILKKYNFRFQKKFGQNFLIDDHVLNKIVDAAEITKEDCVLEIGPGIGTLTQYLCERAKQVITVEIDKNLIPILKETLLPYHNVMILQEDILKTDIQKIIENYNENKPIKIVANLPYYITTPIIMRLLESYTEVTSITVMVQKEVASRMKAVPGTKDYGALSLAVQYYALPYLAANVPPNCFLPRPNVGSAVIRLTRYQQKPVSVKNEELMFRFIHASFHQRRKTLVNALSHAAELSLDKKEIEDVLTRCHLPLSIRGEALTLTQFAELTDAFSK